MRSAGFVLLYVAVVLALLFPAPSSAAPNDQLYTHPGQLVAVDADRLNLYCIGSGSPTVVFDAGWEDWAPAWAFVQPAVARWTRACSYDRAGAGFSDPGPMPRTSVRIADELHTALHRARIRGPYVLVGHSFGSYNTRAFADRYMPEVAGLVLVDGEDGDVESPSDRRDDRRQEKTIIKELRACRDALAAGRPLPHLGARHGKPGPPCSQQFFRGLPERTFSTELSTALLTIVNSKLALYDEVISEMTMMPWDETYLQEHRRSFESRPVYVLTAQNHFYDDARTPVALHRQHVVVERTEARDQARWLSLSSNSKQIFASRSGHYIQLDEPYLVIDAIHEIILKSRL